MAPGTRNGLFVVLVLLLFWAAFYGVRAWIANADRARTQMDSLLIPLAASELLRLSP